MVSLFLALMVFAVPLAILVAIAKAFQAVGSAKEAIEGKPNFCKQCGNMLQNDWTFCNTCGKKIELEPVVKYINNKKRIFNDLPDLGKAREIKKYAVAVKYGAGLGAPAAVYAFFSFLIGPIFALVPAGVCATNFSKRVMSDCNEAIGEANDLRDVAINGGCGVKGCTLPKDLKHKHTYESKKAHEEEQVAKEMKILEDELRKRGFYDTANPA